jgi:mannose-6-phosphate isomerase-like protein (cupin superfamily)
MTAATISSTTPRLAEIAQSIAERPEEWLHRVRLSAEGRWYERLLADDDHEVWLISWLPGQATGFHDHGESEGAFAVVLGSLEERDPGEGRTVDAGESWTFGRDYVHDVRNASDAPAVSVHVYSPPLSSMRRYEETGEGLVEVAVEQTEDW